VNKTNARTRIFSRIMISVVMLGILAACGPKAPAVDPNLIYTQAAETVAAQMAETLAAVPPATETPEPSPTVEVPTATATSATIPTFTPNAGAATVAAFPTSTQIVTGGGDKAMFAYSSPADGAVLAPGEVFQLAIGLQNVGSTTWTQDYKLVYSGGTQISATTSMAHDPAGGDKETVPPGEKGEYISLATAPTDPGEYKTTYFFYSPAGAFIYEVFFFFKVQ
jgi:Ig-like domain from next to BRCA1 gene